MSHAAPRQHANITRTQVASTRIDQDFDADYADDKLDPRLIAAIVLGMVITYFAVMGILSTVIALGWHA